MSKAAPALPSLPLLTSAQRFVWLLRPDLRGGADEPDASGLRDFLYWWYTRGMAEYPACAEAMSEAHYAALTVPAFAAGPQSPPISHFLLRVWRERTDLSSVHPIDTANGRCGFVEWLLDVGRTEVPIQDLWIDQGLRDWLLGPDPEVEPVPRLAVQLWKRRDDLRKVFDLGEAEHRGGLREWFGAHGMAEHNLTWLVERADAAHYTPPAALVPTAVRASQPAVAEGGVNLIGFATAEFGLGETLRKTAQALEAAGVHFSVFEVAAGPGVHRRDLSVSRWISNRMPYRTSVLCMAAFEAADFYLRYGSQAFADRQVIGYWQWELPRWPSLWDSVFELVGEVWAPSRFTQAAFAGSTGVPVLHMPLPVDLPRVEPQPRARFALADGVFQFLLVFDWNSWPARKNPAAAIAAFRLAFPAGDEPVGLAIKVMGHKPWSADFAALKALAEADPRITLLAGTFDRGDLAALYKTCDAYLSLHRAEGFGYTLAEAMLMAKPVVATNWSGNTDFLDAATGCPVEFALRPVEAGEYPYAEGQVWAEPDLRSAAQWMRWLAADWARAAALGRAGRDRILQENGIAAAGARYAARLHQLWHPAEPHPARAATPSRRARRKAVAAG